MRKFSDDGGGRPRGYSGLASGKIVSKIHAANAHWFMDRKRMRGWLELRERKERRARVASMLLALFSVFRVSTHSIRSWNHFSLRVDVLAHSLFLLVLVVYAYMRESSFGLSSIHLEFIIDTTSRLVVGGCGLLVNRDDLL